MYRRILVAIENSAADQTILAHVTALARLTGAHLLLVHVADGFAARHFDDLKLLVLIAGQTASAIGHARRRSEQSNRDRLASIGRMLAGLLHDLKTPMTIISGYAQLMASSDVVHRMIRLSQTLVGHLRGGLAQVVTLFSMFFAGISGSSVADVAVLSRTVAPEMDKEGYDRAFTAALMRCRNWPSSR